MKNIIIYITLLLTLCGCAAKKSYSERILHDSVYLVRDSIVIRHVKDSVSERKETGILQKGDTVFVNTERIVERWRVQIDTVNVEREAAKVQQEKTEQKTVTEKPMPLRWVIYGLVVLFLIIIIIFLFRLFHRLLVS